MTEEEAKTKWCPFARVMSVGKTSATFPYNRFVYAKKEPDEFSPKEDKPVCCIGSACMAWRKQTASIQNGPGYDTSTGYHYEYDHGHCGLAGRT